MLKLVKRDLSFAFGSKGVLFVLLASVPLALFLIGDRQVYSIYATLNIILVHIITTISFGLDARNNSHILFKSLPISNWETIGSKYISIFINFVLVAGYISIVAILMDYFSLIDFDYNILSKEVNLYLLMVNIISLSIVLPPIFLSPPKIGELIGRIGMLITMNSGSRPLYPYGELNAELLNQFNGDKYIVVVFLGMLLSMVLSTYIYSRKEFRG